MKLNSNPSQFYREVNKQQIENHPDKTTNIEGGVAFNLGPQMKLYQLVCTRMFGEGKYYNMTTTDDKGDQVQTDTDKEILKLVAQVAEIEPEFVLQLAYYNRTVMNMRTISIVLLVEAALNPKTRPFVRRYTPLIIQRADELAEAVAYYQLRAGHIGNMAQAGSMIDQLKRGLADAFKKFSEYDLAKYEGDDSAVKARDVLKIVHPKPANDERSALYKKLLTGTLQRPDTWESYFAGHGSSKETWETILPKMGIMAIIRNCRNFLDKKVSFNLLKEYVIGKLENKQIVLNSKQFPFRFYNTYKQIENNSSSDTRYLLGALETAMDISCENLPKLSGYTAICSDHSGSMTQKPISAKSTIYPRDIADMLAGIADKICERSISVIFSEDWKTFNPSPRDGVISNAKRAHDVDTGNGTWNPIVKEFTNRNIKVDRIIVFTDEMLYQDMSRYNQPLSPAEALLEYRQKVNRDVRFYMVNLVGYGTSIQPTDDPRNLLISGWSEKILSYIPLYESSSMGVLDQIRNYRKG